MPGFPSAFLLIRMDSIPSAFHSQMLWGLFFTALVLQAGEPWVEPSGVTCAGEISRQTLNHHMWVWGQPLHRSAPLTVLRQLLYTLSYRISVQLLYGWFSGLIVV